ncbi:alpha/beta fold hydrolase [Arthrobacter sp. SLBN-53]|uniref:alpha/beta fold hydrolase n=1 Tax=Arthrobacter sp. SLBN-53 TaxID=2768412 RepID=UPI00116D5AD2|nr:alpha/beta fold hydrolase [Arthrobacter sp. SLBN-53]TQK30288.1 TAP-like protein [Arthrobacter sp. SLBN-53]
MESRTVATRLGRLRIQVDGAGDTMVFWPSLLMTGDMWSGQAAAFRDHFKVVLIDPPGHGASEKLAAPFTFEDCAQCVVDVLDAVGANQAHFVGNSWAVASVVPDRPDQRELLGRVRTPVLVVAGAEDATFPVAETLAMAAAIPAASSVVLDGVAHLAALENPTLVNALISDFVLGA